MEEGRLASCSGNALASADKVKALSGHGAPVLQLSWGGVSKAALCLPQSFGNLLELVQISPGSSLHSGVVGGENIGPVCRHAAPCRFQAGLGSSNAVRAFPGGWDCRG